MNPVTAISLAGTITQFIEIGTKVAIRVADFSSAVDDVPRAFKQIHTELPLILDGLKKIQRNMGNGLMDKETQEALVPVVSGCLAKTQQLDKVIDKIVPSSDASFLKRWFKAFKSLTYDKKIEEIATSLESYVSKLVFYQVIENSSSIKVEQQLLPYPDPLWLVPFDRNPSFVGRDEIFAEIDQTFAVPAGSQPKAALCGLGGIGKSQIALEYCYRRRDKDKCSILWVNAATVARFEESFNRIASECGIQTSDGAKSDTASLLKNWLEVRHVGSWLMVIDNVDNGDAFFREKMTVGKSPSECIPHCHNGSLLFTTRTRNVAFDAANPANPIMVQELRKAEGLSLIRNRLRENCSEELILELLQELEYIPLAITQAIAFMVKRQKTVKEYLKQYRQNDATKIRFLSYEFSEHARPKDTLESVAKSWSLSFESIRDSNPRAADLLCLINFFQHHGIPAILLQDKDQVEDNDDFQDAVALLKSFSLLNENKSVFSTHHLVQLATRRWLEAEVPEDVDRWAFEALKSIASQFSEPSSEYDPKYFELGEILLPHAELILQHQFRETTKGSELARAKLNLSSGNYILWKGNVDEARSRSERSMEINSYYLGERHVKTMESMAKLGWIYWLNDDKKALPILRRVLENRREILGEDDPKTIATLSAFAAANILTGEFGISETMQREALARSERVLGRKHVNTLYCMTHLADVLSDQGKIEEAVQLLKDVYNAKRELLGDLHPSTLIIEHNLALILSRNDETLEEAFSLWRLNLKTETEVSGPNHRNTLITATEFIQKLVQQRRITEARELCAQCLAKADDDLYKDNLSSQELLIEIKNIQQSLLETDTGEGLSKKE